VKFFKRRSKAPKKWHARALMIDPKKTKLILLGNEGIKSVPLWVYKEFAPQEFEEETQ